MRVRRNDSVIVIKGRDWGKKGKVHKVYPTQERLLVEGVNMMKRHIRARGQTRQAGIIEREAPVHVSNVMLLCTKCGQATRVGVRFLAGGKKLRVCKRCQELID